jgi:hypothetical protein
MGLLALCVLGLCVTAAVPGAEDGDGGPTLARASRAGGWLLAGRRVRLDADAERVHAAVERAGLLWSVQKRRHLGGLGTVDQPLGKHWLVSFNDGGAWRTQLQLPPEVLHPVVIEESESESEGEQQDSSAAQQPPPSTAPPAASSAPPLLGSMVWGLGWGERTAAQPMLLRRLEQRVARSEAQLAKLAVEVASTTATQGQERAVDATGVIDTASLVARLNTERTGMASELKRVSTTYHTQTQTQALRRCPPCPARPHRWLLRVEGADWTSLCNPH